MNNKKQKVLLFVFFDQLLLMFAQTNFFSIQVFFTLGIVGQAFLDYKKHKKLKRIIDIECVREQKEIKIE